MIINQPKPAPIFANKTKLYLVPTIDTEFGEEWSHPKFSSAPSNLTDLPNINEWSESFIITIIEPFFQ